jgi:hypothetical protein
MPTCSAGRLQLPASVIWINFQLIYAYSIEIISTSIGVAICRSQNLDIESMHFIMPYETSSHKFRLQMLPLPLDERSGLHCCMGSTAQLNRDAQMCSCDLHRWRVCLAYNYTLLSESKSVGQQQQHPAYLIFCAQQFGKMRNFSAMKAHVIGYNCYKHLMAFL